MRVVLMTAPGPAIVRMEALPVTISRGFVLMNSAEKVGQDLPVRQVGINRNKVFDDKFR